MKPIYLDYQATTPVDPRVLRLMLPFFTDNFGNAHAVGYHAGQHVAEAVAQARQQIAQAVGADSREIILTSGATESNNLALKGVADFLREHSLNSPKKRILVSAVEHRCVLESAARLARQGWVIEQIPVDRTGLLDGVALRRALAGGDVALVSVMAVNNETGVCQDVAEIGSLCRAAGALFHTDAAQAAGRIAIDVAAMQIDLMSLSAHKVYGPKGVGALYVRRKPRVRLSPLLDGGGQERGLRAGTLPVPLIVGFGAAMELAERVRVAEQAQCGELKQFLLNRLQGAGVNFFVNGERCVDSALNLRFPGVPAVDLIGCLPELALSVGSACSTAAVTVSHVLQAMGLTPTQARDSFRLGLGRMTTRDEITRAADFLIAALKDFHTKELCGAKDFKEFDHANHDF